MKAAEEQDFRQFAEPTARTLLPIAAALTGSQPATELLVFAALTGVARRWRRIEGDRTEHATRLLYRRYTSRRGGAPLDLHPLVPPDPDLDHPREAERRLRHGALRQLDRRSRALLTLRYLQHSDDVEASRMLGVPTGSVAAGTMEALDRVWSLRSSLGGPGAPPDRSAIEAEVRETLAELAAAVEPVDVGIVDAALAANRYRRFRVGAVAGAAVVVVAALAVGLALPALLRDSPDDPVAPDLTGLAVVTGYEDGEWYVLNPDTGDYRHWPWGLGDVSPDLRTIVNTSIQTDHTVLELRSTSDPNGDLVRVSVPGTVNSLRWSPDGARVVGQLGAGAEDPVVRQMAVLEVATEQATIVDLQIPPDRAGSLATGLFWLAPARLAVPTGDAEAVRAHILDERLDLPIDAVSVFDLTGAMVDELPVHQDTEPGQPGWIPHGRLADGRFVLSRQSAPLSRDSGPVALDLAAVDLAGDPGPYQPVTLPLGEPPDGERWSPTVTGWYGTTVYVEVALVSYQPPVEGEHGSFVESGHTIGYLVDLESGGTDLVDPPARFGLPVVGAGAVRSLGFGDAAGLAAAAAHRAFPT